MKQALVALSLGALLATAFAPEFHSTIVGSADLLVPGIASVAAAALCAGVAYTRAFDLRVPLTLLIILVTARFVLVILFNQNGIIASLLGEISKALAMISVGAALALLPRQSIGNTVLAGVLASCAAFVLLRHLFRIDIEMLRMASYLACALLTLASLWAKPASSPQIAAAKASSSDSKAERTELSGGKIGRELFVIVPYAFLFFCFGIFDTFAMVSREAEGDVAALAPYISFAAVALVSVVHRFIRARSLADSTLIVIGIMFLGSLFALAITDDYSPILFNMLVTTIIIAHIPLFVFLAEFSQKYRLSPVLAFGVAMALLLATLVVGETCAVVMLGNNWTDAVVTQTAVTTLFVVSLAALFFLLLLIRKSNMAPTPKTAAPEPSTSGPNDPDGSDSSDGQRPFRAFCDQCGLTEREYEIILLYLSGRSTPFIGEKFTIANSTVKTHIHRAYQKLGVHNKQELIDLVEQLSQGN